MRQFYGGCTYPRWNCDFVAAFVCCIHVYCIRAETTRPVDCVASQHQSNHTKKLSGLLSNARNILSSSPRIKAKIAESVKNVFARRTQKRRQTKILQIAPYIIWSVCCSSYKRVFGIVSCVQAIELSADCRQLCIKYDYKSKTTIEH